MLRIRRESNDKTDGDENMKFIRRCPSVENLNELNTIEMFRLKVESEINTDRQ